MLCDICKNLLGENYSILTKHNLTGKIISKKKLCNICLIKYANGVIKQRQKIEDSLEVGLGRIQKQLR